MVAMGAILPAKWWRGARLLLAIILGLTLSFPGTAVEIQWRHLSSKTGDLPVPNESQQQTACLVLDVDKYGVNDFVLGFRQKALAFVWFRRNTNGWSRYVVEQEYLTIEAGDAVRDIDGDGDADLVFGGDWRQRGLVVGKSVSAFRPKGFLETPRHQDRWWQGHSAGG
jgi:hypothetical protein